MLNKAEIIEKLQKKAAEHVVAKREVLAQKNISESVDSIKKEIASMFLNSDGDDDAEKSVIKKILSKHKNSPEAKSAVAFFFE